MGHTISMSTHTLQFQHLTLFVLGPGICHVTYSTVLHFFERQLTKKKDLFLWELAKLDIAG